MRWNFIFLAKIAFGCTRLGWYCYMAVCWFLFFFCIHFANFTLTVKSQHSSQTGNYFHHLCIEQTNRNDVPIVSTVLNSIHNLNTNVCVSSARLNGNVFFFALVGCFALATIIIICMYQTQYQKLKQQFTSWTKYHAQYCTHIQFTQQLFHIPNNDRWL